MPPKPAVALAIIMIVGDGSRVALGAIARHDLVGSAIDHAPIIGEIVTRCVPEG